jgi:hypothetical protein
MAWKLRAITQYLSFFLKYFLDTLETKLIHEIYINPKYEAPSTHYQNGTGKNIFLFVVATQIIELSHFITILNFFKTLLDDAVYSAFLASERNSFVQILLKSKHAAFIQG